MSAFPTPFTVTVHGHSYGPEDVYNEREDIYTDRTEPVMGWSPPSASTEDFDQGRRTVVADIDLLVTPDFQTSTLDEITLPSGLSAGRYKVEGVEDLCHGPFGTEFGNVVVLKWVKETG